MEMATRTRKKSIALIRKKKTILQVEHIFLHISLLLLLKCEIVFTDFLFLSVFQICRHDNLLM